MEVNRNHYFMIGIVLLALGIQFRMVESVTLTSEASQFLAKRFSPKPEPGQEIPAAFVGAVQQSELAPKRTIKPPQFLGWALISLGAVLVLHSLAMPKPG